MTEPLKTKIETTFNFTLNQNQYHDLNRLFYEINQRDDSTHEQIISQLVACENIKKSGGRGKFSAIKEHLIKMRFPLTSKKEKIDAKKVYLARLKEPLVQAPVPAQLFIPEKIFVEKAVKNSGLLRKFYEKFPEVNIEEISQAWEYVQKNKFNLADLKKPLVFIVKEEHDFLKPCPCTKGHLGCNYWILNLGFGCPYDCSYCFLQHYSNFPGIMLPANLDDFFNKFDSFYKKIKRPIRIGTGEFCDSLALDHISEYSTKLIDFFRDKHVFFELKTKSDNTSGLLETNPTPNCVIAWSLNPQSLIDSEELGAVSLEKRLEAARQVQNHGFSLAFHFDPVIYSENWEKLYQEVIEQLYAKLTSPFKWISIGTLRGTRKLKDAHELRFPQSNIFCGELFLSEDKKLRYPKFLRKQIYENMLRWIRKYDQKTPVYLCMEDKDTWQVIDKNLTSSSLIEQYLLRE
ncbi:MAG: radical SAM protein [Candidatus Omnitrophica bacterium]|nr:radical SAM protein [Candidatus Omnitrophota bacterium]